MPITDRSLSAEFYRGPNRRVFVSRQIKFQFNRESRLIASTWRTSRITRLEKREERKRKIPGSRLIHFSAEITDISFIRPLLLPPLFFPFSFLRRTKLLTRSQVARKSRLVGGWIDRSIDRSVSSVRRNGNCAGRILEWASRESRFTRNERRTARLGG